MGEVFYFHQKIIGFEVNTFGQSFMKHPVYKINISFIYIYYLYKKNLNRRGQKLNNCT